MKIVCISDTHSQQGDLFTTGRRLKLPEGDLMIHAGDLTSQGRPAECAAALSWLGTLAVRFTHGAVVIAGNHDFLAERDPGAFAVLVPPSVIYLNDSGVCVSGVHPSHRGFTTGPSTAAPAVTSPPTGRRFQRRLTCWSPTGRCKAFMTAFPPAVSVPLRTSAALNSGRW